MESQLRFNVLTASLVSEIAEADQFLAGLGDQPDELLAVDGIDRTGRPSAEPKARGGITGISKTA